MRNFYRNKRMDFCKNPMKVTRWALLALAVVTFSTPASSSEPRVVCYYTNWSVYRPGTAKFNPQNINPYLCTHLIYAFGGFTKDNTLKPFDKYQDIEKGGYAKFTGLKTYNNKLKTLLAIGGWNEGSSRFSPMVASKEKRKEFVRNAIKFLRQNRFDGLDLDWEYPAFRDGGKPKDRENYAKLVKELREEFERESEKTGKTRLLLTMAVPAGIEYIQKGFDVKTLNKYLDWMNLLTYDYHSAFEPAVNHHSPLYPLEEPNEYSVDNELNIDYTIKFYLENGADPDKLVLGIPTYGRSYTLFNPDAVEIGSPADGPGDQGDATREKGYLAYYEICESLKPKEKKKRSSDDEESSDEDESSEQEDLPWTIVQPNSNAMGPFAYKGNQWVGYDDVDIVKRKGEYVAENGLGGIMFWSIDNDDFRGTCHGKPYPLIEAAKEAYILKLGSTDNSIISSPPASRPSSSSNRRRNRPRPSSTTQRSTTARTSSTRKPSLSSTPSWTNTPEPPTTPDPGSDFKCTDEGFFPHPRDCKKYFWCLDSGPSNLGIVAHQFTCPSGLFFNKAADSCDFARNVLCKKPSATTKAPTTKPTTEATTATTTTSTTSSTTRRPLKLSTRNSALFRSTTTSTTTTTTPEPEEEYEDENDATDIEAEDPKVIKELIDLIKKVGGVEQLEKQLGLLDSPSPSSETVTLAPSRFNKKLYQKVLEKTRSRTSFGTNKLKDSTNVVDSVQNSRGGPQNAGLESTDDKDKQIRKDRPQYTSINRVRQSAVTTEAEENDEQTEAPSRTFSRSRQVTVHDTLEEEASVSSTPRPLQYVNIRRARPTSDTADDSASRNALFERLEPYVTISETPGTIDIVSARRENIPEYVTIRRQRPVVEETTTIGYKPLDDEEFQESQETALEREISSPVSPQYTSIVRQRPSTLPPTSEEPNIPPPTTVLSIQLSSLLNTPVEEETETEVTDPPTTTTTTTTTAATTTQATTPSTRRIVPRRRSTTTPAPSTTTAATVTQVSSRNYTSIRRRRPLRPNDIQSKDSNDDNSRKIRSTTPDSREINDEAGEVRSYRRFKSRTQSSTTKDSVPAAASPVSRGRYRLQLDKDEAISLTPIDVDDIPPQFISRAPSTQRGNRRFHDKTLTTVSEQRDSEFSAATVEVGSPNVVPRGRNRFSPNLDIEESEVSPTPSPKRLTFARFTPRPFTRPTLKAEDFDAILDETITESISSRLSGYQARKIPYSFGRSTTLQSITKEHNHDDLDVYERPDDIYLSESSIEEKEENSAENFETTPIPRRKIILKKLRTLPSSTESLVSESTIRSTDTSFVDGPDGKKRFRVIRRRPTSSSLAPSTTTEAITNPPRIRKIIRKKIKPSVVADEVVSKAVIPNEESSVYNYGEKTNVSPTTIISESDTTAVSEQNTDKVIVNSDPKVDIIIDLPHVENAEINGTESLSQKKGETETRTEQIVVTKQIIPDIESVIINEETEPTLETEKEPILETTTTSTTQLTASSTRGRVPYRPAKRLFTSTTESSISSSSRTFSRKYNPGTYTSPATLDRNQDSVRSTTRRSLFSSRTFTRRPFTTARTTQKVEEEEEYEDEEILEEEPENSLVLVPPSKLYTRRPNLDDDEDGVLNNEQENKSQEQEAESDTVQDEDEPARRFIPSSRKPNFGPRVVNSNTFRTTTSTTEIPRQNRTSLFNRFGSNKSTESRKRVQNVPLGYSPPINKETTTKEVEIITDEIDNTSTTIKNHIEDTESTTYFGDDDYLSMPETTTDNSSVQTESDHTSTTNTDQSETSTYKMDFDNSTDDYLEFTGETTEYTKNEDLSTSYQTVADTEVYTNEQTSTTTKLESTTDTIDETTTVIPKSSSKVKTQFDKLFSVSRKVEVTSKLDKHRINKNNETTLIEEGTIMVEKKPKVDQIGEVSRFSLIKIVEDEIPIYLTKLGHVYPVEHPPDNIIRIDEGRNAKALVNFVEAPREHLVASESMNEAYRHVTPDGESKQEDVGKGQVERITGDDFLSYINDDKKEANDSSQTFVPQWQFVPAAYENEQNKAAKSFELVTPRNIFSSPSTLPLEALFKTENPLIAPKLDKNNGQPFVVYSASVPNQNDEANIVKLDVLKEVGRSIETFAKGQEITGTPISEGSTTESHVNIVILPKSSEDISNETISIKSTSTFTTRTTTESMAKMMNPVIEMLMATPMSTNKLSTERNELLSSAITSEPPETTESVSETITTNKISPLDAKRSKFAFPRRPIHKPSNFTRPNPVPRVTKKLNATTINNNSNQRVNKTSTFNPTKSRFTGNRAQNVPVDNRKKLVTPKTFTTESPRSTTERKLHFKPIRPNFRPAFIPRKSTTPASQVLKDRRRNFVRRTKSPASPTSTIPAIPVETTTSYSRRGNPRFKSRNEVPAKNDTSRQPSLSSGVGARNERPRNFVRRKLGGATNATTTTVSTPNTASVSTRRPFRVVTGRRRPVSPFTKATTTSKAPTTSRATTVEATTTEIPTLQPAFGESLHDIIDADSQTSVASSEDSSIEDITSSPIPKKSVKIQRRPLTSLKETDQNPSATNEDERKRQSKKYSSSFRQNQLDEVLKQKKILDVTTASGTTINEFDAETALAIAAHQLIKAPLPTGVNLFEDIPVKKTTPSRTTVDYSFTSPSYAKSATNKPVFIEEFSTPSYKSSSLASTHLTESYHRQTPVGFTKSSKRFTPGFTKVPSYAITSPSIISAPVSSLGPSTARYFAGNRRYTGVSLDNLGFNQEPAYFTREYLLESPVTKTYDGEYQYLSPTTPESTTKALPKKVVFRKISTTNRPTTQPFVALPSFTMPTPRRVPSKKPFEKISKTQPKNYNSKPSEYLPDNFDYYDDQNEKVVQKYAEGTKVILHGKGSIECLDIGNFPHPTSCKKFISCARLESGVIIGWEYVCPSGLSYDPVGGMCNWAAGLGCDDKGA